MKRATRLGRILFLIFAAFVVTATGVTGAKIDTKKLEALKPRSIGPAAMSGRVTAITADLGNTNIIYAGTASGGLWKSTNGGTSWKPIFEHEGSASIGSVALDPLNSDVIWVGTGEGNPRNSQNVGDGIYKSFDGGASWTHLGLEKTEHIHRILIDPHHTDTVYAAALGATWGENEERGVFKTDDGGKSWKKVLYVDEKTGAADLVMDPTHTEKLIAAMWQHRRWPWSFKSGGPGSGLYVTHDGGENWEKRTHEDGLPEGELGRIGLAIAPSRPNIVYALIESKKNALYRSRDGGRKWQKINDKREIGNRPFYYFDLRADPQNENRIYSLHSSVSYSEDGGKSFKTLTTFAQAHSDHHAMWIDPSNPDYIIEGNDGGMSISRDRGKTWRFVENLPVGQFYHVAVDMETPYNIYGGLQDNGSFMGPSQVWEGGFRGGGIRNSHWRMVSFGDGFDTQPEPGNTRYGYSMSQGGSLYRFDKLTGVTKSIRPPAPEGVELRFNWNAGLAVDPFDSKTVYYGSQFLHRSRDRGDSWEIISPDLTTNDPEKQKQLESGGLTYDVTNAENNTTIVAVSPSSVKKGVIWVGTDDGNVQVTRNGGKNWTNVVEHIPGVPGHTWVPHLRASRYHGSGAFVVFDNHRRSDWTPYVYQTTDYGKTWTSLVTDTIRGFVYVIEQDPVEENLLFLGTEFHLYFSIDGGKSWTQWDQGYPTVPTRDLVVHPRDPDLIIGTFGRAIWVMDDIEVLRAMAREGAEVLDAPLRLFKMPPAIRASYRAPAGELVPGDGTFQGQNRPRGALLTYVVNPPEEADPEETEAADSDQPGPEAKGGKKRKEKVKVEILDSQGKVIRTLKGEAKAGVNRATWGLDRKGVRFPSREEPKKDAPEPGGIPVLPGSYTVRVSYGDQQDSQPLKVLGDPRLPILEADRESKSKLVDDFLAQVQTVTQATNRLRKAKKSMDRIDQLLGDRKDEKAESLRRQSKTTRKAWKALDERFFGKQVQGIRRDPAVITSRLFRVSSYLRSSQEAPDDTEKTVMRQLKDYLKPALKEVDEFFKKQWKDYQKAVKKAEISLLD
ncbi:MAG: hypothetical protein ACE5JX_17305 [Acidobacteriota bacterium]